MTSYGYERVEVLGLSRDTKRGLRLPVRTRAQVQRWVHPFKSGDRTATGVKPMKKLVLLAAFAFVSSATPSFAEDGKWRCTYEEQGKTWVTDVTAANGKVLQVMPNGQRQIPEQVIDLGQEVHWTYPEIQNFVLNIETATLEEEILLDLLAGSTMFYSCVRLG